MAFCANCGAPVEGRFCAKCGTPVAGGTTPPAGSPPASSAPVATPGISTNAACALAYVLGLISGIIFLVLEPYNKDRVVRFHAFQSIFFNIALIAISIVLGTLGSIAGVVFFGLLSSLVWLGALVLWIMLMIKAYSGAKLVLPVIGPMAEKQA